MLHVKHHNTLSGGVMTSSRMQAHLSRAERDAVAAATRSLSVRLKADELIERFSFAAQMMTPEQYAEESAGCEDRRESQWWMDVAEEIRARRERFEQTRAANATPPRPMGVDATTPTERPSLVLTLPTERAVPAEGLDVDEADSLYDCARYLRARAAEERQKSADDEKARRFSDAAIGRDQSYELLNWAGIIERVCGRVAVGDDLEEVNPMLYSIALSDTVPGWYRIVDDLGQTVADGICESRLAKDMLRGLNESPDDIDGPLGDLPDMPEDGEAPDWQRRAEAIGGED